MAWVCFPFALWIFEGLTIEWTHFKRRLDELFSEGFDALLTHFWLRESFRASVNFFLGMDGKVRSGGEEERKHQCVEISEQFENTHVVGMNPDSFTTARLKLYLYLRGVKPQNWFLIYPLARERERESKQETRWRSGIDRVLYFRVFFLFSHPSVYFVSIATPEHATPATCGDTAACLCCARVTGA